MAITYIDQFETKKAVVEMTLSDGSYRLEYIATGPIDGTPTEVNATIIYMGERETRAGYAVFSKGVTSVRFDANHTTSVQNQAVIAAQFYNDLQSILA